MDHTDLDNPEVEHERRDVSVKAILQFLLWLSISAVVISVAMWGLFRFFDARLKKEDTTLSPLVAASRSRTPPGPRLEPEPLALKAQLRARENERLDGYSWADQPAGVARIPIARAMDLIAERGVPGGSESGFTPPAPGMPTAPATAPRRASEEGPR